MTNPTRTLSQDTMRAAGAGVDAPRSHAPAELDSSARIPSGGWGGLGLDRRGWMVLAGIATAGALVGAALARDLHRSPLVAVVLASVMVVSLARTGWSWLRGRSRRARVREGLLAHVEEYGGGVYGTGAAITLLVLSAGSLQAEWAQAAGALDFFRGMTLDWWIGFSGESIRNAVQAGMWPLHWYREHGWAGALAVGAVAWAGDALADAWRRRDPLPQQAPDPAVAGLSAET